MLLESSLWPGQGGCSRKGNLRSKIPAWQMCLCEPAMEDLQRSFLFAHPPACVSTFLARGKLLFATAVSCNLNLKTEALEPPGRILSGSMPWTSSRIMARWMAPTSSRWPTKLHGASSHSRRSKVAKPKHTSVALSPN